MVISGRLIVHAPVQAIEAEKRLLDASQPEVGAEDGAAAVEEGPVEDEAVVHNGASFDGGITTQDADARLQVLSEEVIVLPQKLASSDEEVAMQARRHQIRMESRLQNAITDAPPEQATNDSVPTLSINDTGACPYNRPCAQQYVGKSQSCMVISGRLIVHAPVDCALVGLPPALSVVLLQ